MAKGKSKGKKKDGGAPKQQSAPSPSAGHNSAARDRVQRECDAEMRDIETARAGLNEQAGEIRQRLRDAGVDVKVWMNVRKIKNIEDDTEREAYIDNFKESWKALKVGEMPDWVGNRETPEGRSAMQKEARTIGREAGRAGHDRASNPHAARTKAHKEWDAGWCEGQAEIAKELGGVERPVETGNGSAAHA
jgi:uncharacterized protein (UPF0335 family)